MTKYSTSEILKSSLDNVNRLKEELQNISEIRDGIQLNIQSTKKLIGEFDIYKNELNRLTDSYIEKNSVLLHSQILLFQEKIIDLSNRINQIDDINFQKRFQDISEKFFEDLTTNANLELKEFSKVKLEFEAVESNFGQAIEKFENIDFEGNFQRISEKFVNELTLKTTEKLSRFDEIKLEFETIKQDLNKAVIRVNEIDLEGHFDKHDKRLSEIFNAITNINSAILDFTKHLQSVNIHLDAQLNKLNNIEKEISNNYKSFSKKLDINANAIKRLSNQIENNFETNERRYEEFDKNFRSKFQITFILLIGLIILNIIFYSLK